MPTTRPSGSRRPTAASRRARSRAAPATRARAGRPTAAGWPSSASVEKDGRPQPPQIYVMADGAAASRGPSPTSRAAPATREWSPDGKTIAFSSTARPDDLTAAHEAGRATSRARATCASSPRRSIAPTASRASATSIPIGRRRSGRWRSPTNASDKPTPRGGHVRRVRRRQPSAGRPTARDLLRLRPPARAVLLRRATATSTRSPGRRRAGAGREHRRQRSAPTRSRPTASASRSSARWHGNPERSYNQPDLWVVDAPVRHAAQPHRRLRLRHRRRHRRRSARAARPASRRPGLDAATAARSSSASASRATPTSCASTPRPARSTPSPRATTT